MYQSIDRYFRTIEKSHGLWPNLSIEFETERDCAVPGTTTVWNNNWRLAWQTKKQPSSREPHRGEEMWAAMNRHNKPAMKPSLTECSHSWTGLSCPECEERSYLKVLIAELLYRNQVLRFDLIEARDQVGRIERVGADRRGDVHQPTEEARSRDYLSVRSEC